MILFPTLITIFLPLFTSSCCELVNEISDPIVAYIPKINIELAAVTEEALFVTISDNLNKKEI